MAIYNSKYIYEAAGASNAGFFNLRSAETSQLRQSAKRVITVGEEHQIYCIVFHSNSLAMAIYSNTPDNISPTTDTHFSTPDISPTPNTHFSTPDISPTPNKHFNTPDNISPTQKTLTRPNFHTAALMLISGRSTVADVSSQPTPSSTAKHPTRDENHKPCVRNGRLSTARPFEWKWFWNGKNPAELRSSCVIYALSVKCNDCLMVRTDHEISWGLRHQSRWHGWSFAAGGEKRVCSRNLKETDSFDLLVQMRGQSGEMVG